MTQYVPIIYFLLGVVSGVGVMLLGLYFGFRASYDIRNQKDGTIEVSGLLSPRPDDGELDMLDDEKEEA